MDELKRIEKYIGKEALDRAIEIIGLFETELPENPEIFDSNEYYIFDRTKKLGRHGDRYAILLADVSGLEVGWATKKDYDDIGYFEFCPGFLEVAIRKNGIAYKWRRMGSYEELKISKGYRDNLTEQSVITLTHRDEGLLTSTLQMNGGNLIGPEFKSYIDKVVRRGSYGETKPSRESALQDYNIFIRQTLGHEWYSHLAIPDSIRSKKTKDLIAKVFERPINELINNIMTHNQGWRFSKERKAIKDKCETAIKMSRRRLNDAEKSNLTGYQMLEARERHDFNCVEARQNRDAALKEIDIQEEAYKASRSKNQALMLEQ